MGSRLSCPCEFLDLAFCPSRQATGGFYSSSPRTAATLLDSSVSKIDGFLKVSWHSCCSLPQAATNQSGNVALILQASESYRKCQR